MAQKPSYYEGAPESVIKSNDLRLRTKYLKETDAFNFPEFKITNDGESRPITTSDRNRDVFFDALFDNASGAVSHPYFDTFRGRAVCHMGLPISEFNSYASELAMCLKMVGMDKQNYDTLDKCFERWAKRHHRNSLIRNIQQNTPGWDGRPRLENFLIQFFRLHDTETNRMLGKYFWLSLYNRMMNPGSQAPISISLIGAQNVGKSYFSVRLCQVLMGEANAAPTSLSLNDIERNQNDWLRRITGNSIIANIGEMKGFRKTDIETIKEFMTRTVDNVHHKYQQGLDMPRSWVVVMDGNSYDGFQRDETGNRRFYPMFVNQLPDEDGQPQWDTNSDWKADFSNFDADLWQIMAECEEFMDEFGDNGYSDYVGECSKRVGEFSRNEMDAGRGIIRDESTEAALIKIMLAGEYVDIKGRKNQGMFISNAELSEQWNKRQKGTINFASVKRLLTSYGYEQLMIPPYGRGYLLRGKESAFAAKQYFYHKLWIKNNSNIDIDDEESKKAVTAAIKSASNDDGF